MRNQLEAIYRATFNPFQPGGNRTVDRFVVTRGNISYAGRVFFNPSCFSVRNERDGTNFFIESTSADCSPLFENSIESEDRLWKLFRIGEYGGGLGASFCWPIGRGRVNFLKRRERERERIENRYLLFWLIFFFLANFGRLNLSNFRG